MRLLEQKGRYKIQETKSNNIEITQSISAGVMSTCYLEFIQITCRVFLKSMASFIAYDLFILLDSVNL